MINLSIELSNTLLDTPLVRIFANSSFEYTNAKRIIILFRFSLMKWQSTLICAVLSCWTGLWAISTIIILSQCEFVTFHILHIPYLEILCTWPCYNLLLLILSSNKVFLDKGEISKCKSPNSLITHLICINVYCNF